MVGWLKNAKDNGWYKSFWTAALMLILKFTMLSMGMLENDINNHTVATMMRFILMFDRQEMECNAKKYKLMFRPT